MLVPHRPEGVSQVGADSTRPDECTHDRKIVLMFIWCGWTGVHIALKRRGDVVLISATSQVRKVKPLAELLNGHKDLFSAVKQMFELVDHRRVSARNALKDPFFAASVFHKPLSADEVETGRCSPKGPEVEVQYDDVFNTPAW